MSRQPRGVVFRCPQVHHGGSKETPLDSGLDLQRRVCHDQFLEPRDVPAVVVRAAQPGWEGAVHGFVVHEVLELAEHPCTVLRVCQPLNLVKFGPGCQLPRLEPDIGPFAEQLAAQRFDVDGGGGCDALGAGGCRGCCGPKPFAGGAVHYVSHVTVLLWRITWCSVGRK